MKTDISDIYDLIVIGAGPGGYLAAERAGHAGKKVLLIEREHLGGVCLNWGCIPTKSLLHAAKNYRHVLEGEHYGVFVDSARFDLPRAMEWKDKTVEELRKGIAFLMKKNKVQVAQGEARLIAAHSGQPPRHSVQLSGAVYTADNIIIASGSRPSLPPIPGIDQDYVVTSKDAVKLSTLPERVAIIGGGVIGLEFASFFACLGKKVAVFEMLPEIAPVMDADMAALMRNSMSDIDFHLNTRVEKIGDKAVHYSTATGEQSMYNCDLVLVATGRSPNIENLGLEEVRVDTTRQGIVVNEHAQSNIPGIYAIGDVTEASFLAHSASRMAEVAVHTILGKKDTMRYDTIPWAIYTLPEAAGCGLKEDDALRRGYNVHIARYNYRANGRALAEGSHTSASNELGTAKIVIDSDSQKIIGVHLLGAYASENIFAAAIIIENEMRSYELKEIAFPHPTVSEVIREALFRI